MLIEPLNYNIVEGDNYYYYYYYHKGVTKTLFALQLYSLYSFIYLFAEQGNAVIQFKTIHALQAR